MNWCWETFNTLGCLGIAKTKVEGFGLTVDSICIGLSSFVDIGDSGSDGLNFGLGICYELVEGALRIC